MLIPTAMTMMAIEIIYFILIFFSSLVRHKAVRNRENTKYTEVPMFGYTTEFKSVKMRRKLSTQL